MASATFWSITIKQMGKKQPYMGKVMLKLLMVVLPAMVSSMCLFTFTVAMAPMIETL
jgi:hypothetical protein